MSYFNDMFAQYLIKKPNEKFQDETKFNENLTEFERVLNNLLNRFENPEEYIYDECLELKRIIQLESEETIANIKALNGIDINMEDHLLVTSVFDLVECIKQQSQVAITKIEEYEKEATLYWNNNEKFTCDIKNTLKQFKQSSHMFVQNLTSTNGKVMKKMRTYSSRLDNLISEIINKTSIKLIHVNENQEIKNKLNYYVHTKMKATFRTFFRLNHIFNKTTFTFIKQLKQTNDLRCVSFDILENSLYLIYFIATDSRNLSYVALYDPSLNEIKKEKMYPGVRFTDTNINQDLIALLQTSSLKTSLVIMNLDLEIIHEMFPVNLISCTNESFIYIRYNNFTIQVFDWSLRVVKTLHLQNNDSNRPFYFKDLCFSRYSFDLKVFDNVYSLKSYKSQIIFNENGLMINDFSVSNFELHRDYKKNLFFFKQTGSMVNFSNLSGQEEKIIEIDHENYKNTSIKFDSNGKIYFNDGNEIFIQN